MEGEERRYYRFGDFKLDSRRRILYKNDDRLDISSRNFDLLYALVQNDGRVLTHDELLDLVWSGTFVEQSNLKKGISALRQILEESPGESLYIRTVPRQGYAFVAPVTVVQDEPPQPDPVFIKATQTEIYIEETEEVIDDDPVPVHTLAPAPVSSKSRLWPIGALVLVVAVAALASWRFFGGPQAKRFSNLRAEKVSTDGDCTGRISPDGNFVACVSASESGDAAVEIRQLATDGRRPLVSLPKSSVYAIDFSPDGNFVYFVQKNGLDDAKSGIYKIPVLGGDAKFLVPNVGSMAFAADGRILFTRTGPDGVTSIFLTDANGAGERVVSSFANNFRVWDFEFSPNQRAITIALRRQVSDIKNVFYVIEVPLDGGAERVVVPERDTLIASATWTADGRSLLLCVREKNADIKQIWQFFPDTGEMTRITNDNTSYRDIQVLKDGNTLSATAEDVYTNLFVGEGDKFDFRQLTSGAQNINGAFWLRDGRIAYAAVENSAEVIRITSEDGRTRERVTEGKDGYWIQPSLGGDGSTIAFNSNRAGLDQLWRIGLDGRNLAQVTRSETPIFNGKLLSDGTAIYRTTVPGQGWVTVQLKPDGTMANLSAPDTSTWAIDPTERWIATAKDGPAANQCRAEIFDRETSELKAIDLAPFCGIDRITWDRDSRGLTFSAQNQGTSEVYRVSIAGGTPKPISNFRRDRIYSVDWSFDGRKLAVVRGRSFLDPVFLRTAN